VDVTKSEWRLGFKFRQQKLEFSGGGCKEAGVEVQLEGCQNSMLGFQSLESVVGGCEEACVEVATKRLCCQQSIVGY